MPFSGTFLGFNLSWDMTGFSNNNFRTNVVFPPISFGGGFDFKINPPNECDDRKWISPFAGRKHMSIGTNVTYDENTESLEYKGFNFSIGSSFGVPFGVTTPMKN